MASLNIPNSFTNNTIADAVPMQQNFDEIESHVNANLVNIDGSVKAGTNAISDGAITNVKIADSAITASKLSNTLPRGIVARAADVVSNSSIATNSQISIFSTLSFTPVANRLYMVCASAYPNMSDPNTDSTFFANLIVNGTTGQNLGVWQPFSLLIRPRVIASYLFAPTNANTATFNLNIGRISGSGSIQNFAAADSPSQLYIIDIGAA